MVARTGLVFALGFEDISKDALRRAQQGEVVIMTDDREERVRALVRLNEFSDLFLYVGRFIETRVLAHRDQTHLAAAQYERLEGQRSGFPDHLRGHLHPRRDAVSRRRDLDRRAFRGAARRPDQPPGRRRRAGARRRSVGARAGRRAGTTNSAR